MKEWIMTGFVPHGSNLKPLIIPAESYDEALEKARKINKWYSGGQVKEERRNKNMYTVYWTGGKRDGEVLGRFDDEYDAIKFAREMWNKHESEFDPVCGGIGIDSDNGELIEW